MFPVFRRPFNSPNVARLIERQPNKPELFIVAERNAVHYLRHHVAVCWKTLQSDTSSDFQRAIELDSAPLQCSEDYQARLGRQVG